MQWPLSQRAIVVGKWCCILVVKNWKTHSWPRLGSVRNSESPIVWKSLRAFLPVVCNGGKETGIQEEVRRWSQCPALQWPRYLQSVTGFSAQRGEKFPGEETHNFTEQMFPVVCFNRACHQTFFRVCLSNSFELVALWGKKQTRHQTDARETQTGHEGEMGCVCVFWADSAGGPAIPHEQKWETVVQSSDRVTDITRNIKGTLGRWLGL